jgi:hypothetical protein
VLLALWHVFEWLRDGIWPHLAGAGMLANLGIAHPELPSPWAQSAIDWLLSWSTAFLLTCSGILLVIIGTILTADYDQRLAASKAARAAFMPATDAERAARWSRSEGEGEDDPEELEDEDAGEEEEEAPPAQLPPVGFWSVATDYSLGCGCLVLLFVIGLGLFIGWDYFDRTHYNRVSARILTVARSCVLQGQAPRDPLPWEDFGPPRSAEMPCEQARLQAPTSNRTVVEIMSVTYTYTSPVDGRTYPGALHRDAVGFPPDVRAGGEMPVYSLKADPSRSRGIYQWPVD